MTNKAFCVGINDYGHRGAPEMKIPDMNLKGCVNDANDWANLLVRHHDFSVADVKLLTDADATRVNIIKGLKDLLAGAQEGDVLVFTNSSHGFYTLDVSGDEQEDDTDVHGHKRAAGSYDEAICPYDYPKLIIDDDLRELFDGLVTKGVNLTTIIDACFSGTGTDFSRRKRTGMREILLSGTTDHALSGDFTENGRPNGFMTYSAIKIITDARDAGYWLTYAELHEKLLVSIKNSGTKYETQLPQLEASEEDKNLYIFTNEFKARPGGTR